VASVGGGIVGAASVGRDPGAQPTGVVGDFLLRISAQMTGGVVDLDDAARDIRSQPLAVRRRASSHNNPWLTCR
jgi:hypothetical protein